MDILAFQEILRFFASQLPPGPVREEFLGLTLGELGQLDVDGPEWQRFLSAIPPEVREAATNRLIVATKQTRH